jgi:hypothetical protein
MKHFISSACVALVAMATLAGCTMKKNEAPELAGPSEFSTSIVVNITPDILSQDGASQSVVTVTARDENGQPVRNLSLRAEIRIGGVIADFGSLSARSIVTGADGKATLVYTAPPSTSPAVDPFTIVDIAVIPIGNDFGNSQTRVASVRLVPPGVVIPQEDRTLRRVDQPGGAGQLDRRVLVELRRRRHQQRTHDDTFVRFAGHVHRVADDYRWLRPLRDDFAERRRRRRRQPDRVVRVLADRSAAGHDRVLQRVRQPRRPRPPHCPLPVGLR